MHTASQEKRLSDNQENVKERIIEASIKLFLAKGFAGTTTKELTDAAGVAKGTLYWHFRSKDKILEEVLDRFSNELWEQAFDHVNNTDGGFIVKFKALYRFITEFAREKKELLLVSSTILGEVAGTASVAEHKMREIQMKAHAFMKGLLDQGKQEGSISGELDTDIQAHIIIANLVGMHLQWCLHGESFNAAAYARAYRSTILKGLGAEA